MSVKLNHFRKPEESQKNSNFNGKPIPYPGLEPGTSGLAVYFIEIFYKFLMIFFIKFSKKKNLYLLIKINKNSNFFFGEFD
jgi:hypothetical protein